MSEKTFEKEKCDNHAKCMQLIQSVIDGSANDDERKIFDSNLEKCKPCYDGYQLEMAIKANHQKKVEKICCPQKTIELLKQKIGLAFVLLLAIITEIKLFCLFIVS